MEFVTRSISAPVLAVLLGSLLLIPSVRAEPAEAPFHGVIVPMMTKSCYGCHNAKLKSGGINLQALATPESVGQDREKWETVLRKLEASEMPPKGLPRPDAEALKTTTQWLHSEFDRLDASMKPDPGRVTARRLNRAEYNNTIRDLIGVDVPVADDFPQDDSGYGFDNIGDALSLPPVLMGKYLSAAERVVHLALEGPPELKPTVFRYQPPPMPSEGDKLAGADQVLPYTVTDYDLSGLSLRGSLHTKYRFPAEADYRFRVSPNGNRPQPSEPFDVVIWMDGKPAKTFQFIADPNEGMEGKAQEAVLHVAAGEHQIAISALKLFEGLPAKYGGLNPTARPPVPPRPFESFAKLAPDATDAQKADYAKNKAAYEARVSKVKVPKITDISFRVDFVEIIGPFAQVKGADRASLRKVLVCGHLDGHHNASCPRRIMADFARRAYRRPVTPDEVDRLVKVMAQERQNGASLNESLSTAMEAVLISPKFLFRIEQDPEVEAGDSGHYVGPYELASRLSYFLWSTMPDEALLKQAATGRLRDPQVLNAEIRRMLKDPKADEGLVKNFGGQWLQFRALESVRPDPERFPLFSDYLRMSMQRETELFFSNIIREDRSVLDFLNGKYTFANEVLARFYGIPDVKGPEFRRVDLAGTPRGGVLTQGSVLTASSYSTRTSVVLRGKWVLENLLNAPVPPPPPNVPALNESAVGTSMSLRQQMEEHRKNPICSSCHSRMDPLGFGMENFDATGHWRTLDGKFPIDSAGILPNGKSFHGPDEMKTVLMDQKEAFTRALTEKMLTYALGRGLERYDRPVIKQISSKVAANDYRVCTMVEEIASSLPFQKRRGDLNVYVSQK